jgi:hypothetical protein
MKRSDYIVILLLVLIWFIEDLYLLFPSKYWFNPFPFSEKEVTLWRYIFDIIIYVKFAIFAICILIAKNISWLTRDVICITIGLTVFSLVWYMLMHGNPYYRVELWLKFLTVGAIYVAVKSIQYAKRNNRIHHR